jgi:hypothetical protein
VWKNIVQASGEWQSEGNEQSRLGDGNGRNYFDKHLSVSAIVDWLQVFLTAITRQQATSGELHAWRKFTHHVFHTVRGYPSDKRD